MLKDLATIIMDRNGKKLNFEIPNKVETAGYSKASKARLNDCKIQNLGWKPRCDIKSGIERTIGILESIQGGK